MPIHNDDCPWEFQQGRASGYGYDKTTAALSGMWIDGFELTNHCRASLPKPAGLEHFPEGFKAPKGYFLANWLPKRDENGTQVPGSGGYADCYRRHGLEFLEAIGYRVIQAI